MAVAHEPDERHAHGAHGGGEEVEDVHGVGDAVIAVKLAVVALRVVGGLVLGLGVGLG